MAVPIPINLPPKVSLVDLTETNLRELADFIAAQSGREAAETLAQLTWLLLENPACHAGNRVSLGCGARAASGKLVGCILHLPQMFVCRQTPLLLLGSSCFYVDESHRGSGGAIFLKFARAANQFPLFGNSANAISAQLWKARGATPIPHSDHELVGIVHWPPVVEELAARSGLAKPVARFGGSTTAWLRHVRKLRLPFDPKSEFERLSSIEQVMELPLAGSDDFLTALRDEPYIRWRYFSGRDPSITLFAFRNRRTERPMFVAVNERPRGYRAQIRSLNLLDVFPRPQPAEMVAIVAALHAQYRNHTHMIVLRNLDAPSRDAMLAVGFRRRNFESPNGWLLDPKSLLPTRDCYFVPADGDWII